VDKRGTNSSSKAAAEGGMAQQTGVAYQSSACSVQWVLRAVLISSWL